MEAALKKLLVEDDNGDKPVRDSVMHLLESNHHTLSTTEVNLRTQLQKIVTISQTKHNFILQRPKTIKAFIIDDDMADSKEGGTGKTRSCGFSCLFLGDEKQFCV